MQPDRPRRLPVRNSDIRAPNLHLRVLARNTTRTASNLTRIGRFDETTRHRRQI
jgi:hypothetical protein